MVDVYRMVSWLVQLMQDADTATRLCSGREDGATEVVLGDYLRAAEGEEDATWLDLLECFGIELLIASERVAEHFLMLGEGWRIEDDQIVELTVWQLSAEACWIVEEVECIGRKGLVTWIAWEVEVDVGIGK